MLGNSQMDNSVISRGDVFIVTSTIVVSTAPLSYIATRSVFSREERFAQTLRTLKSVRTRAPGAYLMLVDNSSLDQTERLNLSALADMLIYGDDTLMGLRDHPNKGVPEAAMVRKALNLVRHWPHKRLFKLSGRYELTDAFRVERFSASRFSFLLGDGVYSTVLYSVPQAEEALFDDMLSRVIKTAGALDGIERLMRDFIPDDRVELVPQLGISGFIAVDGTILNV